MDATVKDSLTVPSGVKESLTTALRDVIARAIYEEPTRDRGRAPVWDELSQERRAGWLADADRVITALRLHGDNAFDEFATKDGGVGEGVDWLATTPCELWREFWCHVERGGDDGEMCAGCDCWRATRAACS